MAINLIRLGVPLPTDAGIQSLLTSLVNQYGGVYWPFQEASGAVADAINPALSLGRDVALNTYADYTAGANWSNPSGEIARHAAGATATLQQDGILAAGKTYQATIEMSNRTAGSISITDGGAAIDANGTTLRTISSTSTDFIITPTSDFDGDIDVSILLVQQSNILASSAYPGAELLTNGDFSAWTGDDPDAWIITGEDANNVVTERDSGQSFFGTNTIGGSANFYRTDNAVLVQQNVLTVGKRYKYCIVCSVHAGGALQLRFGSGNTVTTITSSGIFEGEGTCIDNNIFMLRAGSNGTDITIDSVSVQEANPLNGDHTGVTVGQTATNALGLAVEYDGTNDYTNIYSTEINSFFQPDLWTEHIFAKVSGAGVWTDNALRVLLNWEVDANNYLRLSKNTSNELQWDYMAGGTLESVTLAVTPTDYFLMSITVNASGNMTAYYNGAQTGSPQAVAGSWVGNLAIATIGALNTTPTNVWDGFLTHVAGYNAEEDANVILQIARAGGAA
jgi:hypothetical protein